MDTEYGYEMSGDRTNMASLKNDPNDAGELLPVDA